MRAPNWSDKERALLELVWNEPGSLKMLAAKYFPGRTSEGLKSAGIRLGLPASRGRLKYHRPLAPGAQSVREALESNDSLTCYEIEIIAGTVTLQTVQKNLKQWLEAGEVHIVGWRRRSHDGQWSAAYRLGRGENVPKPARKTQVQVNRDQYARNVGMRKKTNPFLVCAGLVAPPPSASGRIIRQDMASERTEAA